MVLAKLVHLNHGCITRPFVFFFFFFLSSFRFSSLPHYLDAIWKPSNFRDTPLFGTFGMVVEAPARPHWVACDEVLLLGTLSTGLGGFERQGGRARGQIGRGRTWEGCGDLILGGGTAMYVNGKSCLLRTGICRDVWSGRIATDSALFFDGEPGLLHLERSNLGGKEDPVGRCCLVRDSLASLGQNLYDACGVDEVCVLSVARCVC